MIFLKKINPFNIFFFIIKELLKLLNIFHLYFDKIELKN
jgi:hypothetical protein